jgi:hypothetical protein
MSKKAIFAQATLSYWVDVAAKLRDDYGWEICYVVGSKLRDKVSKLFPNTPFHTKDEIRKNLAPEGCEGVMPSPIDKPLLSSLSEYESIFLKMMDRQNYDGSMTYQKRISTYHSQLMYWKGVLEHFRPDIVVFRVAPHTSHDYSLYALCRVMGIPTVMFERTSLPGFVYPVTSFEEGSGTIGEAYTKRLEMGNLQELTLAPETLSHLQDLSRSYADAKPSHLKSKLKYYRKSGDLGGSVSLLFGVVEDFARAHLMKRADNDRESGHLRRRYQKKLGRLKRKKLLAHYNQLADEVDLTKPYVFVALQCEPERQTCPVGGVFGNQYLMVDVLSKLVPENWKIYVKEHVSQFKVYQAAERSKSVEFYNMIASMPKVELVPLSYTSFELIDRAKASTTVSGTVGWESVVRGKPTLLFGHSWYRDCEGVFVTHTVEDCKKVIEKIKRGYTVDKNKVKCFAQVVESCSVRGYTDKIYEKMKIAPPVSLEENIENLARAIHEFTA